MHENPTVSLSDIQEKSPQEIADQTAIPVLFCDHQATRRQRIHGAAIPFTDTGYSSTHLVEVLEHLAEIGYDTCIFLAQHPNGRMLGAVCRFEALAQANPEIDPESLK